MLGSTRISSDQQRHAGKKHVAAANLDNVDQSADACYLTR